MDQKNKRQFYAEFMLATVTLFWGATFPIVKDAINEMPVMAFLWVRFAIAAILLAFVALLYMRFGLGAGVDLVNPLP